MFSAYIIGIIAVAYAFDFVNGFHDAANSVSTVISTKVLPPVAAVAMAAFFNFIAFFFFGVAVATTVGKGIIVPEFVDPSFILAALVGAIAWDLVTWYLGLPSSSSHALIGGLIGAGITKAGLASLQWGGLQNILFSIPTSPFIGFVIAFGIMAVLIRVFFKTPSHVVNRYFRRLQLFSSAIVSLSHGTNDAQKTMGVVTALLVATGNLASFDVPYWVAILAAASIALGTFFGGWRIVKTLGFRMTKMDPVHGFSIETASAVTILGATYLGIPVSTTHVVSGGVMGSGATMGTATVKWGVARRIVWAWLLTIPAAALVAGAVLTLLRLAG